MTFSNPQMKLENLGKAVKPWNSPEAHSPSDSGRYVREDTVDQAEIDACLECPFPECNGKMYKCRSYRARAEAAARRRNASLRKT